jgi:uncharacterized membrane protein
MSYLIVLTFDDPDEADQVRASLKNQQREGLISLDDSAVIVKDADGKTHVKNEMDRGTKVGAVGGGALGLLIGGLLFPVGGLILGALAGGLIGALTDKGISKDFVKDVTNDLTPGSSAIFFIERSGNPTAVLAMLRQYNGNVYHTSLPEEAEEQLREALKEHKPPVPSSDV